jgi:hypothetical protein
MKINNINSTNSFYGKELYLREFSGKLFDGNTAHVRISLNSSGNPKIMEAYTLDKDNIVIGGKGIGRTPNLRLTEVTNFLNGIRKSAEGWDVFEKFAEVMPHHR